MGIHIASPATGITQLYCATSPHVALFTDAASADLLPATIRDVADSIVTKDLSVIGRKAIPEGLNGALIWCQGEKPLAGGTAEWRRAYFMQPACNTWVTIHWPCVENADLLGLEPRIQIAGAKRTLCNPWLRISGSVPSPKTKAAWRDNSTHWAQLSLAIWQEIESPGTGVDALAELWQKSKLEPPLSALLLRNLIVALMRRGDFTKSGELLELGKKAFASYRELVYLHGVFYLLQNKVSKAVGLLESALGPANSDYAGSGGENSYRARYLLGRICDAVGQQEKAVNYWIPCINERPAFDPAVHALLQQLIPRSKAAWLHQPLGEMVRREPRFLGPVLNFMLAHGMIAPARRLAETMEISAAQREIYSEAIAQVEARRTARPERSSSKPGVLLSGPLLDASGHARINRAVGLALLNSPGLDVALDSTAWPTLTAKSFVHGETIWRGAQQQPRHLDLTIRHQWPPVFDRPSSGKLVCIVPWEHKAVPKKWVEEIEAKVDELWTPSNFVRNAFLSGGVSPHRVRMLRNAVDSETFNPRGPFTKVPGARGFTFLFVGGPIRRKGIDLLLQAYGDAFSPADDVTLIVKDLGSRSFYSAITRLQDVQTFGLRPGSPHVLIITEELDDRSLAALYRGANVLVHPYRGEGFGMPIVESMACGTPAIVTGEGPAIEFCTAENSYLLTASEVPVPEAAPPVGEFTGEWTWFEPDVGVLARTMRHVYENREEARHHGQNAAIAIQQSLTWERVLPGYFDAVEHLIGKRQLTRIGEAQTSKEVLLKSL